MCVLPHICFFSYRLMSLAQILPIHNVVFSRQPRQQKQEELLYNNIYISRAFFTLFQKTEGNFEGILCIRSITSPHENIISVKLLRE
jgi:hypothetical protein